MKKILLLALLLTLAGKAHAQIQVTATVQDTYRNLYTNCFGTVSLVIPSTATQQPLYNGSVFQTQIPFNCDSLGRINGGNGVLLLDNNIMTDGIVPTLLQWKFSICASHAPPTSGLPCFNLSLTITGASPQDITAQIQAAAALLRPPPNLILGNGTTVFDASYYPGAPDMTLMMQNAYNACVALGPVQPNCTIDGRGIPAVDNVCSTIDLGPTPFFIWWPAISCTKSVDNYEPLVIEENLSGATASQGTGIIQGMGKLSTFLINSTSNATIVNRSTNGNTILDLRDMYVSARVGDHFATVIEADAGVPNFQNPQLTLRNIFAAFGYYGIREDTSFFDTWDNIVSLSGTSFVLEGGNGSIRDSYTFSSRAAFQIGSSWSCTQFIANVVYSVNQLMCPRNFNGHMYKVSAVTGNAKSGSAPPTWPTGSGATVTNGNITLQEDGIRPYLWLPNYTYPANAIVSDYADSGYAFQTTAGGTACNSRAPAWDFTATHTTYEQLGTVTTVGTAVTFSAGQYFNIGWTGTVYINGVAYTIASVNSGTSITLTGSAGTQASPVPYSVGCAVTWVSLGNIVTGAGADPATWTTLDIDAEEGVNDCVDLLASSSLTSINLICSLFQGTGVYAKPGASNVNFLGAQINPGQNAVAGINLVAPEFMNLTNIVLNGSNGVGNNTGTGVIRGCNGPTANTPVVFSGIVAGAWSTLKSYPATNSCTYPGFTEILPNGGVLTDGSVTTAQVIANTGPPCTNGELSLSAGWGTSPTVTNVQGLGQTCRWTITAKATTGANPTITDTLTNPLPNASTVCSMRWEGGTDTQAPISQTTLSATAPVFTFNGTPTANDTSIVVRTCGP